MSCAKTAEPIETPFGCGFRCAQGSVLSGARMLQGKGAFLSRLIVMSREYLILSGMSESYLRLLFLSLFNVFFILKVFIVKTLICASIIDAYSF